MKRNEIIGEHKKGYKAMKYQKKTTPYIGAEATKKAKEKTAEKMIKKPLEEMDGQMVGKVSQVKPDGTVDVQKPDGSTTSVQQTALTPGQDPNKLQMSVPKIVPGQEVDAAKTMEGGADSSNTYKVDASSGVPMAQSSPKPTTVVASKMWQAITPEIEAKAAQQGFRTVYLSANGKTVTGLEGGDPKLGSKILVSPTDYAALSAAPTATSPIADLAASGKRPVGPTGVPIRESVELSAIKRLSGL